MEDATLPTHETREEFLTARQLATILQVSEATVRRLARAGRIPSIRLTARLLRFHLPSVRNALDHSQRAARTRRTTPENEEGGAQLSFTDLL